MNKIIEVGRFVTITVGVFKGLRGYVKDYRPENNSYGLASVTVSSENPEQIPDIRWQRNEIELT